MSSDIRENPAPDERPRLCAAFTAAMALLPLLLGFSTLFRGRITTTADWVLEVNRRVDAHAMSIAAPKVIFVGGSNVLFGIDARSLERRLGQPVINYGLHAGIGADLIAEQAAKIVRAGDTVVYVPEWSHFRSEHGRVDNDNLRYDYAISHGSDLEPKLRAFPMRQYHLARARAYGTISELEFWFLLRFQRMIARQPATHEVGVYETGAYDTAGNLAVRPPSGQVPVAKIRFSKPPSGDADLDLVTSRAARGFDLLSRRCKEASAHLSVMPPIRIADPQQSPDSFAQAEQKWLGFASKRGASVLLGVSQTTFGTECLYNTEYHLNQAGVALLEDRLVDALQSRQRGRD